MKSNNPKQNIYLFIGGLFLFCFAVFQLSAIWWGKEMMIYFGGPVKMQEENPFTYALLCIFVAAIIAAAGLYSFSGAGKFRKLPFLRTVLTAITVIFFLRGLMIILNIGIIIRHPEENLIRFAVYSLIAIIVGVIYLTGLIKFLKQRRQEKVAKN
jgi:hypothetical protein